MVQDKFDRMALADNVGHLAELDPGGRVQHDDDFAIRKLLRRDVLAELLDLLLRVEELQRWRDGEIIDQQRVLAAGREDCGHRQFAAQGVTVGTHVTDQQKPLA